MITTFGNAADQNRRRRERRERLEALEVMYREAGRSSGSGPSSGTAHDTGSGGGERIFPPRLEAIAEDSGTSTGTGTGTAASPSVGDGPEWLGIGPAPSPRAGQDRATRAREVLVLAAGLARDRSDPRTVAVCCAMIVLVAVTVSVAVSVAVSVVPSGPVPIAPVEGMGADGRDGGDLLRRPPPLVLPPLPAPPPPSGPPSVDSPAADIPAGTLPSGGGRGRFHHLASIVLGAKVSSTEDLWDRTTPQGRAMAWLAEEDLALVGEGWDWGNRQHAGAGPGLQDEVPGRASREGTAVLLRYSLAVLYCSTSDCGARSEEREYDLGAGEGGVYGAETEEAETAVVPGLTALGRRWKRDDGWLTSGSVCLWHGVTCSGQQDELGAPLGSHRVGVGARTPRQLLGPEAGRAPELLLSIRLADNDLDGTLPPEVFEGLASHLLALDLSTSSLGGTVPREIRNAEALTHLYLGDNLLTGTLPNAIGALPRVTHLFLNENLFTGTLPSSLGSLTRLQGLGLHQNGFRGTLPARLGRLRNLNVLYLDENELTGTVPDLTGLSALADLRLRSNALRGRLPRLPGRLELLYADTNAFSGTIPASYGALSLTLEELHLYRNSLRGRLPASLGNLSHLTVLYADHNRLSSSIPPSFSGLVALRSLFLFENDLTGTVDAIAFMSNLRQVRLGVNSLSGTVPSGIGALADLEELYAEANLLGGTIPETLGGLGELERLHLEGNLLVGSVPASICGLRSKRLETLVVDCGTEISCDEDSCCTFCA